MDRAYRAAKRGAEAVVESTPKKRKRSPSLPGTPEQAVEPAAPPAELSSASCKKELFATRVQVPRLVEVRPGVARGRLSAARLASRAARVWRAALTPPRPAFASPADSW